MLSAYLQIYNDDEFLSECLQSIKNYVDDLIIVDGCYEWMEHYYTCNGFDPARSTNNTYEIIENSGIPYTSINKVWKNQLEKRQAGYSACKNRYILRIDSDEIFHFHEKKLRDFLASDSKIAHIDMPELLTPSLHITGSDYIEPKQCFLFDSKFISAEDHLRYLWLVLHADNFNSPPKDFLVHNEPIAFNKHLTGWRTPITSINRAAYYTMNWMRKYGYPHAPYQNNNLGITNFQSFFDTVISPKNFRAILKFSEIIQGRISIQPNQEITAIPDNYRSEYIDLKYHTFISTLDQSLTEIVQSPFISGAPNYVHLSKKTGALKYMGSVQSEIIGIDAELIGISAAKPHNIQIELRPSFSGKNFFLGDLSEIPYDSLIRGAIKFTIWSNSIGSLDYITLEIE